jgi:MFS family permease
VTNPLREPRFAWFFTGRAVSLLGTSMAPVALAFAVLDASDSTSDLGIVVAAHMVPLLAFLLIGGAVADRFSRRTVLVTSNVGSGLTQAAVAVILLTHHYSLLGVAALEFANGVLAAFTTPALRGVVPELVPGTQLQRANAVLGSTRNATKIIGPSAAGILVATAGSGSAIAFDAATYLLAAACIARVRLPGRTPPARSTVLADIRAGWTAYRAIRWVWIATLAFFVINLVNTGTWQVLGPALTKDRSGEAVWGFVLSARGAGLLVMSVLMYRLVFRYLLRAGQLASALGSLPLLALGLGANAPWLIGAALIGGVGSSVTGIAYDTSLQEHVPKDVLSRVSSYDDLLSYLAIPIGQLAVGPLAQVLGGRSVAFGAGVIYALAAVSPLLSRSVRMLPHATATAPT